MPKRPVRVPAFQTIRVILIVGRLSNRREAEKRSEARMAAIRSTYRVEREFFGENRGGNGGEDTPFSNPLK